MHELTIEPLTEQHWPAVREIYLEGIRGGNATFEQSTPAWSEWDVRHLATCRLIARSGEAILAWAALSAVSSRHVYKGVAEVSIYVASRAQGHGIGSKLLTALIAASEQNGLWTLQAGVFPENVSSIRLHERAGFRVVGIRKKLGCMHGRWRDIVLLERRSVIVGL
jgi:phosphinothricin acetyltransferase